jgi:hypothetical protein
MLRIIGRTIEHVIGRSSDQLEGVETEAKLVGSAESEDKSSKTDDQPKLVYMLDIIDASGFLHVGSAISNTFPLLPSDRVPYVCALFFG